MLESQLAIPRTWKSYCHSNIISLVSWASAEKRNLCFITTTAVINHLISIAVKKNVYLQRQEALTRHLNHHIIKGLEFGIVPDVDGGFDSTFSLPVDGIASTCASKDNPR